MTSIDKSKGQEQETARLRESEERFRRVFEEGPLAMALVDTGFRFTHVNSRFCEMLGYTEAELIVRTFPEITHPDDVDVDVALAGQVFRGEIPFYQIEKRYLTKVGEIVWINLIASVVRDEEGSALYGLAMVEDITERREAEKARERYKSMVTASSDLMVFVDATYTYRAVNQAYCDEHGRTEEEILGRTVAEVFGEKTFETTLKPHLDRCLSGERVTFRFWWDSPSRGRSHVEARYDPFFEADGSVSGVLVDVRDTTDRMQIEEQLERSVAALEAANRELEAFSDSVAHDLRNPLVAVTQFGDYLAEALGDSIDEEQEDYLQRIRAAGRHMMHIVDDLRELANVSRVEISQEEVDLSSLGSEIIAELRALVPEREVRFEVDSGITAVGDKTLLRLLLTNLIQNAWKYTRPSDDARIELGIVEDERDGPTFYVRDNGIGFDNDDRERIFRPFERLHSDADFSGSGLGLATVERIVRRHHGRVWAEGIPGQGTIVHFTLEPHR